MEKHEKHKIRLDELSDEIEWIGKRIGILNEKLKEKQVERRSCRDAYILSLPPGTIVHVMGYPFHGKNEWLNECTGEICTQKDWFG